MEREGIAIMDKEISSEGAQNRPTPAMRTALRKNITISSSPQKNSEQGHESSCEENMVLKVENSTRLVTLKEDLCPEQNGTVCELCPPGWRLSNSKCYYFSGEKQSWEASARNCANRKSRLLVLEDEAEAVRVQEMRPRDEYFWIGYKYNTTQGQWMWLDDPGFSRYRVSAKYLSQLECVSFKGKNSFAPEKCSQLHYCVCKKNVTVLEP
ncbi:killer cell lectin-like receptor subfamily F member 1 isoform X2 [Ornithorhynchus anatinus]|uniref:killer cell lectin-like receptor subfamily F member 1 isoform X2 n=1 Tax=Ornithorhynchus anatinus TaxID=9258 RepID=UPI0010A8B279|nr:killer cell lectin-like receptor subfamily F member 1 isoform X2 [Ornithorhynchus anatinus]